MRSVVGRTPWSGCPLGQDALVPLLDQRIEPLPQPHRPARGPAADQGVRPTKALEFP
jgi:hypothetical protein